MSRPSPCTATGATGGRPTAGGCWPPGSTTLPSSAGGSRTPLTRRGRRAVRYPAAGTANADVTLHVLRLDGTRTEVSWDRGAYEYLTNAGWDSRGPLLSVQSRDQRTVLVLAADADTGRTTLLHTERDDVLSRTEEGGAAVVAWRGGTRAAIASHEAEPALKPRIRWLTLGPR